jgi:hypothetical protein
LAIVITAGILTELLGFWFLLLLFFALDWFYHTAFEVLCRGQSPGKRLMGIRVIRGDGSPVNPGASFLRNLLRFADTFMFLYLIAFICMLVSPGFRRLGDWVADTLVVYTDNARSPGSFTSPILRRPEMPWLADVPMAAPSRKLNYEEKQALLMFARRYPLLGKARADEIARLWVGEPESHGRTALESGEEPHPVARGWSEEAENLRSEKVDDSEAEASAYLLGIAHTLGGAPNSPPGRLPA